MNTAQPTPDDMLAVAIERPGGPEVLKESRHRAPRPGEGEVLIRVAAAGVNGPDLTQRAGAYPPPADASPLPGLEVAGVVLANGPGAGRYGPGASVVALCNGGGYAEQVVVPEGQVLPKPAGWSWQQAAALPETAFTVQQTLIERSALAPGMTVLVHGGSGGLGATAIQMATLAGARVFATASGQDKVDYARSMGADAVIDYRNEDFVERIRALTRARGVDRILDIVGGDYLARNLAAAARGAVILQLAMRQGAKAEINLGLVLMKALTLSGSTLRPTSREDKARFARGLETSVWPAIDKGTFRPARVTIFPLRSAADAHRILESGENYGKVVLETPWGATLASQ